MLRDALRRHAQDNVWCSPLKDRQSYIKPARLSEKSGTTGRQRVMWEEIPLPTSSDRYHVFQIGHIYPRLLGLMNLNVSWQSLQKIINNSNLIAEVYLDDGTIHPRMDCYFRWDRHRNLLLAVRDRNVLPGIRTKPIFLRVYTNDYYDTSLYTGVTATACNGVVQQTNSDRADLRTEYHNWQEEPGAVFAFHNGRLVDDFQAARIETGDVLEYVYDASVETILEWSIEDLRTYLSDLDQKNKYLLHDPDHYRNRIEYFEDVDIYVLQHQTINASRYDGVYYPKSKRRALRQVTHKDYSVPVDHIDDLQQKNTDIFTQANPLFIRAVIRNSGYQRDLIYDSNRLFELYRLPQDQILDAMVSDSETLPLWHANALEGAPYVQLMRSNEHHLPMDVAEEAYGYNGIAYYFGYAPITIDQSLEPKKIDLLAAQRKRATVYEYDSNGVLLGYNAIINQMQHTCQFETAHYAEAIPGLVTREPDVVYNQREVTINPEFNYRVYRTVLDNDTLLDAWEDITDDSSMVHFQSNSIYIDDSISLDNYYVAVVSDGKFVGYTEEIYPSQGVFRFHITTDQDHGNGLVRQESLIPPLYLDLWMNGYALVEGLDFIVRWPEVVITNISYLQDASSPQEVTIRATGFCNSDMTMSAPLETGFVQHGYLGDAQSYRIRDDRVYVPSVGGRLQTRDAIAFAQYSDGVAISGFENGTPYQLREIVVPFYGDFSQSAYAMREQARAIDQQVEDYMSMYYDFPVFENAPTIPEKYAIYSPFVARVIALMEENYIDEADLIANYGQTQIETWLADHLWLLDYDPAYQSIDDRFVAPLPHPHDQTRTVTIYQYRLIKRVIDYYFDGAIPLSQFVQMTVPGSET